MRKVLLLIITALFVLLSITALENISLSTSDKRTYSQVNVYEFMKDEKNQKDIFNSAVKLNDGNSANACVYFISEVLRRNNFSVPKEVCNTEQILTILEKANFKRETDYKKLKPGDICFTTDAMGNKNGIPTHTYVFMGWVKEGSYDYAYICDNQAKDYKNKVYHIRNISIIDKANGFTKDAFSFFMKLDKSI